MKVPSFFCMGGFEILQEVKMDALNMAAEHLIGQPVKHSAFGHGTVESLSGNVVTVNFSQGDKKFIYPDAFKSFLRLEDEEGREEFNRLMEVRKRRIEAKKEVVREKEETRRKFRSKKLVPNSQAVFNVSEEELKESTEREWAFTGRYQSGFSEGRARTAGRIKPNSLCMLTTLGKSEPESERQLRGLFMAREDFYGDECTDGQVDAHKKYRLLLSPENAFRIWDAVDEADMPKRFGGLHFRYVSENSALSILKAVKEKLGEEHSEFMDEFIKYYCRLNSITITKK